MHKMAILVKSFSGDHGYVKRLIASYHQHNRDQIPLFLVVPETDLNLFQEFVAPSITLMSDESITSELTRTPIHGLHPGYVNQEIIKMAFWEKRLCENYICVDSEGVFIRDFFVSDFMYDESTPYTILIEDNELRVDPQYYHSYWKGRHPRLEEIQRRIGLPVGKPILTCHGFAILSSKVLESFRKKYLLANHKTYLTMIEESPFEFTWYNLWLQYDKTIELHIREPLFKTFHSKNQQLEYMIKGITNEDLARGYLGVVVNSYHSRESGIVSFNDENYKILAGFFTKNDLIKALFYKVMRKLTR